MLFWNTVYISNSEWPWGRHNTDITRILKDLRG